MLNNALLKKEVQDFIRTYEGETTSLAFAGSPFEDISVRELIGQIESRRKIVKKLPVWYATEGVYYPPSLNLEQTSSELTARYKASLLKTVDSLLDATGGFGVDTYFFSEEVKKVTHVEQNEALSKIAKHNFELLRKGNIECLAGDGMELASKDHYDVIYADPSRRHGHKGKVFFLKDCEPDIPKHLSELLKHCQLLMVKTSPMLDISAGLKELNHVAEVHVVAVNNEVKELIWMMRPGYNGEVMITAIDLKNGLGSGFKFQWNRKAVASYSEPKRYLYEPNAALMKSGAYDVISEVYEIEKLRPHSHLYTSDTLIEFPGRRFEIGKTLPYSRKEMRRENIAKANIATRNFPESVAQLRKKWNIQDGGDIYVFFTTIGEKDKVVLVCEKVGGNQQKKK